MNEWTGSQIAQDSESQTNDKDADVRSLLDEGIAYFHGRGVPKDYDRAFSCFQKSAEKGQVNAQYYLGLCHYYGYGTSQDYKQAVFWFRMAAEEGQISAQYNLGLCHYYGYGLPQDYTLAVSLFQKAAEKGHTHAIYNLGLCYENGFGIPRNITMAKTCYHKAANKGNSDAANGLKRIGKMFYQAKTQSAQLENQKFTFSDLIAIAKLSIRPAVAKVYRSISILGKIIMILFFIEVINNLIFFPLSLIKNLCQLKFARIRYETIYIAIHLFIVLNPKRTIYALHYKESTWYRNTGIRPSEVTADQGLYGEYIATMCAEQNLTANHATGYIFNNVIIPKLDGDFNEIDIVAVSELGIQVIEVKARKGTFYGSMTSPEWTQKFSTTEYKMENPFLQNLSHINYLKEYLWDKLPEGGLKSQDMSHLITNVVLFALDVTGYKINSTPELSMPYYFGLAEKHFAKQNFNKCLAPEEVSLIRDLIIPIASYSRQELQEMMQRRAVLQERKAFQHKYTYYIANMQIPSNSIPTNLICRDNGYYRTYYDDLDGQFKAQPEAWILSKGFESNNFDTVWKHLYHASE